MAEQQVVSGGIDSKRGWLVVLAAFLAMFVAFGVAYSFGAFFAPMSDEFGTGSGATSAVFAITTATYFGLGLFSGRAADRFGPRPMLLVSAVAMTAGLLATSQVNSIWLGYVTYGLGVGIGVGFAYVPVVAMVGAWFERKRTIALALAVTGIGLGTLLMAPLAAWLIEQVGWRNTYVYYGIASGAVLLMCALLSARPPTPPGEATARSLGATIRERPFQYLYISALLLSLALFVPFVFIATYAQDRGVGSVAAASLVGIIGAASVVGRLGLGIAGGRIGTVVVYKACFLAIALSFALWFASGSSFAVLVVFTLVMGTAYGGFITLSPAVAAEKFGPVGLGGVIGAIYSSAAIGGLLGPPGAGLLIDAVGYRPTILVAMGFGLLAFASLVPLSRDG